jgi:hypothetical protein
MPYKIKQINFGEIDHFLYVRINCLCADLGYNSKEFVEQAYCILTELIDEKGVTHFKVLAEQYKKYADYREMTRYAPRMKEKRHAFVVDGIHEEIHEHLVVIKDENKFSWGVLLSILLMVLELDLDKQDKEKWKDGDVKRFVVEEFLERRFAHGAHLSAPVLTQVDGPHRIDKTKKARAYEKAKGLYPEGDRFRGGGKKD